MINVGIYGVSSPVAGELLRVLIYHPDVRLRSVTDKHHAGHLVSALHHGLIGECNLEISDSLDASPLDVLFIALKPGESRSEVPSPSEAPELCVIDIGTDFVKARHDDDFVVYAVPELNRKSLVRGAKRAIIPSALESIASVALLPLAAKSMLPDVLNLNVEAAPDVLLDVPASLDTLQKELVKDAGKPVAIVPQYTENKELNRVMRVSCDLDMPVPVDNIVDLYEAIYDDHNLTYIVGEEPAPAEVEGTDKCIISLDKSDDGKLELRALADARLRGGAGDAVHVMNLLMGLYEKTGLSLKASRFA